MSNPFETALAKPETAEGVFSEAETRLANRNSGILLEGLRHDITPIGMHYLLTHFDVPMIDAYAYRLKFGKGFEHPMALSLAELMQCPTETRAITLECAGNGRAAMSPRSHSQPWFYEAVGTSKWTGTPLAPLLERAKPSADTIDISFTGADIGFDKGVQHAFGRSLTLEQIEALDVMVVWEMNGQPLLPQHGAPLRLIVPGWYGMASVKWLSEIEALSETYQGFQQIETYRFRQHKDDPGRPVTDMRVKSLMVPPGVPDWISRKRFLKAGKTQLMGRAWSGLGRAITEVEVEIGDTWVNAKLDSKLGKYGWTAWHLDWMAAKGDYILRCRATDSEENVQPLEAPFDIAGFANNVVQEIFVYVRD